MKKKDNEPDIYILQLRIERLEKALKPFADYADREKRIHRWHVVTFGTTYGNDKKRQLTMGDCYDAAAVLKEKKK